MLGKSLGVDCPSLVSFGAEKYTLALDAVDSRVAVHLANDAAVVVPCIAIVHREIGWAIDYGHRVIRLDGIAATIEEGYNRQYHCKRDKRSQLSSGKAIQEYGIIIDSKVQQC